ncbi:MAG: transcriptional regulator [Alphaproteobacteria bacterium]|nr:transcriptional regulator [Alphaproteobacteria bacterium]
MSKPYHYTDSGLDWIRLANGFTRHDTAYGAGVSIQNVDALHDAIARLIVETPARIRGQEVRFLRAFLDLSQAALAETLGVQRLQVARWEGASKKAIPGPADRALRLIVAGNLGGNRVVTTVLEQLRRIDDDAHGPVTLAAGPRSWSAAA